MDIDWNGYFARHTKRADNGCIEWAGGRFTSGYGHAWDPLRQKSARAHRMAYERLVGPIPEGMSVCHHCDNKPCVNVAHLFLGTARDNVHDKIAKGRDLRGNRHPSRTMPERRPRGDNHWARTRPDRLARGLQNGAYTHPEKVRRGEQSHHARLTEPDVRAIRARLSAGESDSAIARDYAVNHTTINRIKLRITWRHVG